MATTFPTYPATTFEQAVELAIFSSNQLHNIINADATSTVETEDGDISSVRKALVDNLYFKSPVAWSEGNTSTVFNQLYYFYQSGVVNGYYYAPTATESNPVEMNSTPVDDDNWLLYSAITQQSPSEVYPYTYTATADTTSITTGYDFDTAIVTVNGVVLVPDVDYTITDSTTITLTNPIGVDTDTGLGDVLFAYLGKIVQGSGADYATYTTLAKSTGASIIGTSSGNTIQDELDSMISLNKFPLVVSIWEFLPSSYKQYTTSFSTAQSSGIDCLSYINTALSYAATNGVMIGFPSGYYPVSDTVKQINSANVIGNPKKTFIIPTTTFTNGKFLWVWPIRNGAPQKYISGMGFQGASGHTDTSAQQVGGFAIKSGNWHSTVSDITISNCFYGGFYINPQHVTGSSGVSDCVNLKIDHIWVLDGGALANIQCLDIDFVTVDTDTTYAEDTSVAYTSYTTGNWTDGQLSNLDLSCADTDPANYSTAGPYAMRIKSSGKTMFNVLIQRVFTATRKQTHIYIDNTALYNCQFSNFSGETHNGVSGLDYTGMGTYSVYHVNIVNGGQWNTFDNFYGNASLGNNGLYLGTISNCNFSNMTIDINYPGDTLDDGDGTTYPKKITIASTSAKNITFRDCNIRGFEDDLWNTTYYQYRDIFSYAITDNGFNTVWESPQMSSNVTSFRGLDFFTNVKSTSTLTNGSVLSTLSPTFAQGSDLSLTATLTASTSGTAQEANWTYSLTNMCPAYADVFWVTLRYTPTSGVVDADYVKVQMFEKVYKLPIHTLNVEHYAFLNFSYNSSSSNQLLAIMLGTTSTTDLVVNVKDIIVSPQSYAYIPSYSKAVSGYYKEIFLAGANAWTGTNTFTGVSTFNNANTYIGTGLASSSVGLQFGSKTTAGTAYMDWYSSGSTYAGARQQVTGGSTSALYAATYNIYAGTISLQTNTTFKGNVLPTTTATYSLGSSTYTWNNLYVQNAVTVVSDADQKTDIDELSDIEISCAIACGKLYRKYKLKAAVAEKGEDEARYHVGTIAQSVIECFKTYNLDWTKYGIITYEEWDAQDATTDEEGNILTEAVEAGHIYMMRYEEFNCFVNAGQQARLEQLEAMIVSTT